MARSVLIAEYLDKLTGELSFDPRLSRRVRQEVEDHLLNGIEHDAGGDPDEAARLAIAGFGDPREIARQYAPLSLLQQARRVGGILVVAIAAILVLMKGRSALYDLLQWRLNADWLGISTFGPPIDRYGFMVALVAGVLGWVYIGSRRVSPTLHSGYRLQLKRCLLLSVAAAGPLIGSVITDAGLSGLRLSEAPTSLAALIPLMSMAIEVALASIIVVQLRKAVQRRALISSLFSDQNANY
jgi:hypothetical protein